MRPTRRDFLKGAGAGAVGLIVAGCAEGSGDATAAPGDASGAGGDAAAGADGAPAGNDGGGGDAAETIPEYTYDGPVGPEGLFAHGVASGDPLADAVILWSRVSPDTLDAGVPVFWELARDTEFADRVAAGTVETSAERDFTVKLDATGLSAGTTYYYRFKSLGRTSPIGRTRTLPSGTVERVRLAVCSCSKYSEGYFHGFRAMAQRADLDAVLHLGDYIYESGGGSAIGRQHEPSHTLITLADYRTRYAQHRRDPDLQEAHRQHPFIAVWDDHEVANNAWATGAEGHAPATDGAWEDRKAAGLQAYAEWIPIREQAAPDHIFRQFQFGDLVDLLMLDTRIVGRDAPVKPENAEALADPVRQLLGLEQEAWLKARLAESTAAWRLLGQQIMFAPLTLSGAVINADQWDGYPAARQRVLDMVKDTGTDNVVILSGDIHSSWACDVPADPLTYDPATGDGSVMVEYVAPGVTSGFPIGSAIVDLAVQSNPHIKWGETEHKGYIVLDVSAARAEAAWYHLSSVEETEWTESAAAVFAVADGETRLTKVASPAAAPTSPPAPAP